jgi:pimeloyl-ACP methyl ester carboxylesterase
MSISPVIHGPDPIELDGRRGQRYWVYHPAVLTGDASVDEQLAGYPVAVFGPPGRSPERTPLVLGLQGMAAPYQWNGFLLPTLLDRGIAVALFDVPLAGERSLARAYNGDVLTELAPLIERRVAIRASLVPALMDVVARDCGTVLGLAAERHGLTDGRLALFGVSLGTLLLAYTFLRDGRGERLLGAIGHADLRMFARSYQPRLTPLLACAPVQFLGGVAAKLGGPKPAAGLAFLRVLRELSRGSEAEQRANPMRFIDEASPGRRVRFLIGAADPLVRPEDAQACARRFPDGACYVVPGLGHGGDGFVEHARYFVATQLGDWAS